MAVKYTTELTAQITEAYNSGKSAAEIAEGLDVPERSIIAKLSSLGIYKKKEYRTKRGEVPVKKGEYIERIAALLDVNAEMLESLEKVNKQVLALLVTKLPDPKSEQTVTE